MMLMQIKNILQTVKTTNLLDLTQKLNCEPDVVRDMLAHWMRKGRVRRCEQVAGCAVKCAKCNPLHAETYEWVEG